MKKIFNRTNNKILAGFLSLIVIIPLLTGCQRQTESISRSGFYFNTIITITLYNTSNAGFLDECFEIAEKYERMLSSTIKDSEIATINANAGSFVEVSRETRELIEKGILYGDISEGFFDITIGPLTDLWNISEISAMAQADNNEVDASVLPQKKEILKTMRHVDYHNIEIQNNRIRLTDRRAKIDLGGIAKGYIADRMKEYLNANGIVTGIINLGGNVLTLGPKENAAYTIGIQKPFGENGDILGTLTLPDASVVSSGIYERYYRVDNEIYHHILDPATGYPVKNELWQVTIISQSSVDGDALSTTCFALGLEAGMSLVEATDNVEAIFVTSGEEIITSSGIGKNIQFTPKESK